MSQRQNRFKIHNFFILPAIGECDISFYSDLCHLSNGALDFVFATCSEIGARVKVVICSLNMNRFQQIKYHSYQFEQFFPIVYDRTRYWLIIKTFGQKTSHFHEKSLFSVTLVPWWQSNALNILKIFSILLKPISKGNFILLLDGTIPIFIFLHRHSQHPTKQ